MKWSYLPPAQQDFFSTHHSWGPILPQLFWNRGLREKREIQMFLHSDWNEGIHDPFLFRDMEKAVERLNRALEDREHIKIIADYDADGITSGTILYETLEFLGAHDLSIYIPNRFSEGYGIKPEVVETCREEGVKLIITVDVGITAHEALEKAHEYGIDVIICDHHHAKETLPPAQAILHPHLPGETYPFKDLSGVGVTYKLAQALLRTSKVKSQKSKVVGSNFDSFEKWLLDLVAIGTVADIVPILGENRTFVKYGLIVLNKTKRVGLRQLILGAGLKLGTMEEESTALSTRNIGWQIAPRINAASRMEHGVMAFHLLSEKNESKARIFAEQLDAANRERQALTARISEESRALMENEESAAVLSSPYWPSTVCGLVAGRLADAFFMPVFLFEAKNGELYEGSGRSVEGIDVMEILDACKHLLLSYGGHPMACGLKIQGNDNLVAFKIFVKDFVGSHLPEGFEKTLHLESLLPFSEVTSEFTKRLQAFEPYGEGNRKPVFRFNHCNIVQVSRVGSQGNHLKLLCSQKERIMKAMQFNIKIDTVLKEGDMVDIAGELEESMWNGNREIFINVKDIRLSES